MRALIAAGYNDPRELLTATPRELQLIVGVGKIAFAQIEAYRARHGILPQR